MGVQWYYQSKGRTVGPVSGRELKEHAGWGLVKQGTLVRKGEDGKWVAASRVKGLFSEPPPPEPPVTYSSGSGPEVEPRKSAQPGFKKEPPLLKPQKNKPPGQMGFGESMAVVVLALILYVWCGFGSDSSYTDTDYDQSPNYEYTPEPAWNPSYVNEKLPPINQRLKHIPEARQREVHRAICLLWAALEETNDYKRADVGDQSFMEDAALEKWVRTQHDISDTNACDIWSKGDFLNWDIGPLKSWY